MATAFEISEQVDILADAYGKVFREGGKSYDGYLIALRDVDAKHLRLGVSSLLRDKLQFMPTPAEVRAHAKNSRELEFRRESADEHRRLVCARCEDRGILRCFNRRWFAEHRDEFSPQLFSEGWLNVARAWCKENYGEDFLIWVICGCDCLNSRIRKANVQRYRDSLKDPSIKANRPPIVSVYDADWDCLERCLADPRSTREQDYAAVLLEFQGGDKRTWQGNWTP